MHLSLPLPCVCVCCKLLVLNLFKYLSVYCNFSDICFDFGNLFIVQSRLDVDFRYSWEEFLFSFNSPCWIVKQRRIILSVFCYLVFRNQKVKTVFLFFILLMLLSLMMERLKSISSRFKPWCSLCKYDLAIQLAFQ